MPANTTLEFQLTTALSNAVSGYIDDIGFAPMQPLYAGGPSVMAFSASAQFTQLDRFYDVVSNGYNMTLGPPPTQMVGGFQTEFLRMGLSAPGVLLPSSASPTIPDSLITP
jgi:hypothetical protein